MPTKSLPLSGYAIGRVFTSTQSLRPATEEERAAEEASIRFGWDWRSQKDHIFEVRLVVAVEPSKQRPEWAEVDVVGVFRQEDDAPAVPLDDFVRLQAVAILLPYARQFLSALTQNSVHGAYYLPTVNVAALMKDFDPVMTTWARQRKKASAIQPAMRSGKKDSRVNRKK